MVALVTVRAQTSNFRILIELLILYSLVYFTGFLNERLIYYVFFFVQLKWSGCIYTLTAVSGLKVSGLPIVYEYVSLPTVHPVQSP